MAGRTECFPSQFALFPSFEYYYICSAHNDTVGVMSRDFKIYNAKNIYSSNNRKNACYPPREAINSVIIFVASAQRIRESILYKTAS